MSDVEAAERYARERFEETVERLARFLKVPAISCEAEHEEDVRGLAKVVKEELEGLGLEQARVIELPGALPIVAAERQHAGPDRMTVLIYGHLDLQPVAGEAWNTPPHEATLQGERLYARGAADDMGGWVSHLAALQAWLQTAGELPVNVKVIIESEEEIGSPNLERFMQERPEVFEADAMVLTDCENPSTEMPGLTVSLRGLYEVELSCEALSADVHSGLWGNMVPDAGNALVKLLARLVDDDGRMRLGRTEVDAAWRAEAAQVPLTQAVIRSGGQLLGGVEPLPERGRSAAEWLWRQPAVTVLSTTLPTPDQQKNALRHRASALLSVRLAPGQTRRQMRALLEQELLRDVPGGVRAELTDRGGGADSWLYEPQGPVFEAADRAYEKAWGHRLLRVGVGGSIPFVALFGRRFGDLPLLLNGVMDPQTGAHGPNESLHLGVFRKAILANVHLLHELGQLPAGNEAGGGA